MQMTLAMPVTIRYAMNFFAYHRIYFGTDAEHICAEHSSTNGRV